MNTLKKLSFIDFIELISGYSEIEEKIILINNEVKMTGTINDFKELIKGLKVDVAELTKMINDFEDEINQPVSSIEIHNYLRKLTNDFSPDETKIALHEMIVFRDMVLEERLFELAKDAYIKNDWKIPTYTKTGIFGIRQYEDVKKMTQKVFPFHGFLFYEAISLLRRKLDEMRENKLITQEKNNHQNSPSNHINAKHHVLAYIFDCHATGTPLNQGKKKELEQIGNNRIGPGKGNRFYKAFNETTQKDLNTKKDLIEIAGEEWREIVLNLSQHPRAVEEYLDNKGL